MPYVRISRQGRLELSARELEDGFVVRNECVHLVGDEGRWWVAYCGGRPREGSDWYIPHRAEIIFGRERQAKIRFNWITEGHWSLWKFGPLTLVDVFKCKKCPTCTGTPHPGRAWYVVDERRTKPPVGCAEEIRAGTMKWDGFRLGCLRICSTCYGQMWVEDRPQYDPRAPIKGWDPENEEEPVWERIERREASSRESMEQEEFGDPIYGDLSYDGVWEMREIIPDGDQQSWTLSSGSP